MDELYEAALARGLTGFTLFQQQNGAWQASSRWGTDKSWRVYVETSATDAIEAALTAWRGLGILILPKSVDFFA